MIKAVIIDDDRHVRAIFEKKITKRHGNSIQIVGSAKNVETGIELVNSKEPDLVFLDMEMPDGLGFDLVSQIDCDPLIVLITASDAYGIEALNRGIHHYLLKPIQNFELDRALYKVKNILNERTTESKTETQEVVVSPTKDVVVLSTSEGYLRLKPEEIMYSESEGMYTTFFLTDGDRKVISKSIKYVIPMLPKTQFIRVNQSNIVNKVYVTRLDREGYLYLSNGITLHVSVRLKSQIRKDLFPKS